jgi:hypothetical protein
MSSISSLSALSGYSSLLQASSASSTSALQSDSLTTSFASTGIPDLTGTGYAYPPGSEMTSFMDSINNEMAAAMVAPDGSTDIMTWANGLAQQAALEQQQAAAQTSTTSTTGTTDSTSSMSSMLQMLQSMLSELISQYAGQSSTSA